MNANQADYYGNRLLEFYSRARLANDVIAGHCFDLEWVAIWRDIFYQYQRSKL